MYGRLERTQPFIGRKRELALFDEWLFNPSPKAPWILYFYDALEQAEKKGGVGKTWLLQRCEELARKRYQQDIAIVRIDFFNVADRDGAVIADHVVKALEAIRPDWEHEQYTHAMSTYLATIRSGKEHLGAVRSQLADALLADLSLLNELLQEKRLYLLMLFDTYELIEQNPIAAVLRYSQSFPDIYDFVHIGIVIAGRNPLDWMQPNWRDRKADVREVKLAPFNEDEVLQYSDQLSSVDPEIMHQYAHKLYERTEGRPILVGLVTDTLNRRVISLKELISISRQNFESSLVAKINDFERPFDTILLQMAHVYHRFNFELLYWLLEHAHMQEMLGGISDQALKQQLLGLSFVRRPGTADEDFVLHDEMRPLITRYCWEKLDPDKRSRKEISGYMVEYYENKLAVADLSEQLRQAYIVEMLYHKLFLDITHGYTFFAANFEQAIFLWLSAFARSLLQETKKFLSLLSLEQQYSLKRYEAQLLQKEEKGEEALVLYEQLEHEASIKWLEKQHSEIIYEKGVCYFQLRQFPKAITSFTFVKDMAQKRRNDYDYASMLNWLGATYLRQGQLDTALHHFDESIAIHKRLGNLVAYTSLLTSTGDTYRLQGKINEALSCTKTAHRLRSDLFTQGKISEVFVGWSLNAIGIIYMDVDDFVEAEKFFQNAYEIFTRIGSKKGQSVMYNHFGQLDSFRKKQEEALEWYQKAYKNSLGNINMDSQIESLNLQGELFIQKEEFEGAEKILTQSVELARTFHDYYQQAEALITLIKVYNWQGKQKKLKSSLKVLEEICQTYNYNYLLGLSRVALGDFHTQKKEYQEGFRYYGEACRFMALYNSIKYNNFLRTMIDKLLDISGADFSTIIQSLITYWREQNMDKGFPDFINLFEKLNNIRL